MDGPGGTVLRPFDPHTDADSLKAYECDTPGQRWTKAAQRAVRAAAQHLVEGGDDVRIDLAVDRAGRIVGAIVYGYEQDRAMIQSIGAVRDRRREGIGTRLKQGVMAHFAAERGTVAVISEVHKHNRPMLQLNEKLAAGRVLNPDNKSQFLCAVEVEPDA